MTMKWKDVSLSKIKDFLSLPLGRIYKLSYLTETIGFPPELVSHLAQNHSALVSTGTCDYPNDVYGIKDSDILTEIAKNILDSDVYENIASNPNEIVKAIYKFVLPQDMETSVVDLADLLGAYLERKRIPYAVFVKLVAEPTPEFLKLVATLDEDNVSWASYGNWLLIQFQTELEVIAFIENHPKQDFYALGFVSYSLKFEQ